MSQKRHKQIRKDQSVTFDNVFDKRGRSDFEVTTFFDNDNPLILELGCGIGVYTTALAKRNIDKNYVGVDSKGERIWQASTRATEQKISNAKFVNGYIDYIDQWVTNKSVQEIWITFPDPHPREKMQKKRLTSPIFLQKYKNILKDGGVVHLKTDDEDLFNYSIDTATDFGCTVEQAIANIYKEKKLAQELEIKTKFEKKWLEMGKDIFYLRFRF